MVVILFIFYILKHHVVFDLYLYLRSLETFSRYLCLYFLTKSGKEKKRGVVCRDEVEGHEYFDDFVVDFVKIR